MTESELTKRVQRAYHAGELSGAIDSYEELRKQFSEMSDKTFMSVKQFIGICASAIEMLKLSRRDYAAQCQIQDATDKAEAHAQSERMKAWCLLPKDDVD